MEKIIRSNGKEYHCTTKEQFLIANLTAMADCKPMASSVSLKLLEDLLKEADEFGPTIFPEQQQTN